MCDRTGTQTGTSKVVKHISLPSFCFSTTFSFSSVSRTLFSDKLIQLPLSKPLLIGALAVTFQTGPEGVGGSSLTE
jgi:hypothetical protein